MVQRTFTQWLKQVNHLTDYYQMLADSILSDGNFPDAPTKSPNRRYLRLEARYCGKDQVLAFDDLWLEYERECMPKRPKDTRRTVDQIKHEERQRIVDLMTEYVTEHRTGQYDDFCDWLLDKLEKISMGEE